MAKGPLKQEAVNELLKHINATPRLQSLLYDLDLMPEQLEELSDGWWLMIGLALYDHKVLPIVLSQEKD